MSDDKVRRLVRSEGKVRTLEMEDGSVVERDSGSVSWRNNNPGNLKFEHVGSADKSVKSVRTRDQALVDAQARYQGVVGLDQWGNAVFESYEAGRAAKIQLLERRCGDKTVEELVQSYSVADYSGKTNHAAQAAFVYAEGDRQGVDLRSKEIGAMSAAELAAVADGIKGFEGWRVGQVRVLQPAVRTAQEPSVAPPSAAILTAAQAHFFGQGQIYEYGRSDLPKPGRDPSRLERDLDGDGRMGVDCSAFVWRGLKNAGFNVPGENAASFTTRTLFSGSEVTPYARQNFDVVSAQDARKPNGSLQPGDILMFSSSSGQHVGIFKGYDERGSIQFIGSQGRTGPAQVTVTPNGYWDGGSTHIVGALRAKPEFQVNAKSSSPAAGVGDVSVATPVSTTIELLKHGDRGATVRGLQEQLVALGYRDKSAQALHPDGVFGDRTVEAVRNFQWAHGLQADGIVGEDTRRALAKAERTPLVSERTHADNPVFLEARNGLRQLPEGTFRSNGELDNAAAAMTAKARQAGLAHIDHVVPNIRGDGFIAVQGGLQDPARQMASVEKQVAVSQSIERSTAQMAEGAVAQQQAQASVQMQHMEHRSGLVVGMRP